MAEKPNWIATWYYVTQCWPVFLIVIIVMFCVNYQDCYGSDDPEKIAAVKELYEQLGLPSTYATYEDESYNIMSTHIQQVSRGLPDKFFLKFLAKIYKRES